MNRLVSKRVACFIYRPELAKRAFCSNVAPELSASTHGQISNEPQNNTFKNTPQHDIVIVGGGMVGMALACALANTPLTKHLSVAIVDKNPTLGKESSIRNEDPPDPRVSTITPASMSFLKDIGAWKYVEQHRHAYFDKMQVWDYTGLGYTRYSARDADKEVLGCVVENKVLHRSLYSCTQDADSEKTIYPSRLSSLSVSPSSSSTQGGLAKLELDDNTSLFAKLVIGADGSKSHVRQLAQFETTGWNYSQSAVICTVLHSTKNGCAWQRFLPAGPIALLPMGDNFSNIVWTMNPKESADYKLMTEEDFVTAINHALDYGYGPHPRSELLNMGSMFSWLKADVTSSASQHFEVPPKVVKLASERMVFPLSLMHANKYVSKRLALVGDAAHTVHPLAGQGVNMGFGDVSVLSKIIAEAVAVGSDVGEVSLLKKYEANRKVANISMMAILDSVQKAYSVDFGPLNVARAAAFHGAQHISLLKQSIISYASGDGRLPLFP
ncbi:ubiquinone biosynthesis monooxygenase COQ6, mitochondrial [Impatiens glandulifera]|uniref:ubiquinone biosynthesis monooxygenase COQ6, mitochondrial n=1 Tax=Impatiens glandulifera TaxID=253017 RepID=UPI001FB17F5E|nr:ubiquinone biosynthesis monooxygenase COQ6, mitochondrial [Impatiens glandulifera]